MEQVRESITNLKQSDGGMQALRQYLNLLEASFERYEYLEKSGAPDNILYTEKGLIARQLQFLSKAHAKLAK